MTTVHEVGARIARIALVLAGAAVATVSACGGNSVELAPEKAGQAGQGGGGDQPSAAAGYAGEIVSVGAAGRGEAGQAGLELGGESAGGQSAAGGSSAGEAGEPSLPPIPPGTGTIGSRCAETDDCKRGLECITSDQSVPSLGSPPNGLCTASCTGDADCQAFSPTSLCFPFDPNSDQGYCIEGCSFGPQGAFRKCHSRLDFSCMPALLEDTGVSCADGCLSDEVCENGTCQHAIPGCLPTCRGDLDCPTGRYCDQSFLGGTCVTQKPTGKQLGEPCVVPPAAGPAEPDGCLGFCEADVTGSSSGHCSSTCGLTNGCAWDPTSRRFLGACYYGATLTQATGVAGDFGYCAIACNCAAQCNDAARACYAIDGVSPLGSAYAGAELCLDVEAPATDPSLTQCK